MLEKLLRRGDVKLLHATRGVAKFGETSVYKSVTEYYYPRCYDVEFIGKSLQCTNQGSSVSAVASPNNLHQEEFGAKVEVTVDETADRKMLYVEMCAYLRDSPLSTCHPPTFQRGSVRSSIAFYGNFNLHMDRSPGFGSITCNVRALHTRFPFGSATE